MEVETCQMERFSTGKVCGKPAKYLWIHKNPEEGTTCLCEQCVLPVFANGGQVNLLENSKLSS